MGLRIFLNPFKLLAVYLSVGTCAFFFWGEWLSSFSGEGMTTWCKGTREGQRGCHQAASLRFLYKPGLATKLQGVWCRNSIQLSALQDVPLCKELFCLRSHASQGCCILWLSQVGVKTCPFLLDVGYSGEQCSLQRPRGCLRHRYTYVSVHLLLAPAPSHMLVPSKHLAPWTSC